MCLFLGVVKRFPKTHFPKKNSSAFEWGGAAYSNPVDPLGYMGVKSWQPPRPQALRDPNLRNNLVSKSMCSI
jgi:hypothetical protein